MAASAESGGVEAPEENEGASLVGETFEVQAETPPLPAEEETAPEAPSPTSEPVELDDGTPVARPPRAAASPRRSAAEHAREAAPRVETPVYGAVGDRAAVDLVAAFKRAFPQAASADPIWERVPVGFYAEGDVTFALSEAGALTHATVSPNAAPAFRQAVARTVALIKGRAFTARGARTRLHMTVRVSDALAFHGAFGISAAGSFELPSGRRVAVAIVER